MTEARVIPVPENVRNLAKAINLLSLERTDMRNLYDTCTTGRDVEQALWRKTHQALKKMSEEKGYKVGQDYFGKHPADHAKHIKPLIDAMTIILSAKPKLIDDAFAFKIQYSTPRSKKTSRNLMAFVSVLGIEDDFKAQKSLATRTAEVARSFALRVKTALHLSK